MNGIQFGKMTAISFSSLNIEQKATYVGLVITVILSTAGLIGNSLTFWIYSRKKFNKVAFSFYIRFKILIDSFILADSYRHMSSYIFNADIVQISLAICKMAEYSIYVASSMSYLSLTFNLFDQMLAIVYPNRFAFVHKRLFQSLLLLAGFIYSLSLYIIMPIYYAYYKMSEKFLGLSYSSMSNVTMCMMLPSKNVFVYMIHLCNQTVVILIFNITLTLITVAFVFKSRQKMKTNKAISPRENKDIKFAVNLIALSLLSVACKTPLLVTNYLALALDWSNDLSHMVFTWGVALYTIENAAAFPINYSVNYMFRSEVKLVLSSQVFSSKYWKTRIGIQ